MSLCSPSSKRGKSTSSSRITGRWRPAYRLARDDVCEAVKTLRSRNIEFLNTPGVYYDAAPSRLESQGVSVENIDHSMQQLKELGS